MSCEIKTATKLWMWTLSHLRIIMNVYYQWSPNCIMIYGGIGLVKEKNLLLPSELKEIAEIIKSEVRKQKQQKKK